MFCVNFWSTLALIFVANLIVCTAQQGRPYRYSDSRRDLRSRYREQLRRLRTNRPRHGAPPPPPPGGGFGSPFGPPPPPRSPYGSRYQGQFPTSQFGGSGFGGSHFGGNSFGSGSFGGSRFGGDSFGGSRFGGDSFGGSSFGGSNNNFGSGGQSSGQSFGGSPSLTLSQEELKKILGKTGLSSSSFGDAEGLESRPDKQFRGGSPVQLSTSLDGGSDSQAPASLSLPEGGSLSGLPSTLRGLGLSPPQGDSKSGADFQSSPPQRRDENKGPNSRLGLGLPGGVPRGPPGRGPLGIISALLGAGRSPPPPGGPPSGGPPS